MHYFYIMLTIVWIKKRHKRHWRIDINQNKKWFFYTVGMKTRFSITKTRSLYALFVPAGRNYYLSVFRPANVHFVPQTFISSRKCPFRPADKCIRKPRLHPFGIKIPIRTLVDKKGPIFSPYFFISRAYISYLGGETPSVQNTPSI